jgi:hypothetical protein
MNKAATCPQFPGSNSFNFLRRQLRLSLFMLAFLVPAVLSLPAFGQSNQIIFDDALQNSWQNWSWATFNFGNTSPVHSGSDSISVTISGGWQAIELWRPDEDSTPYASVSFWLNGGSSGGQLLWIYGTLDAGGFANQIQGQYIRLTPPAANTWQQYVIPLSALGVGNAANFTGFAIEDDTGNTQPVFYLDDITLNAVPEPSTRGLLLLAFGILASLQCSRRCLKPSGSMN